MIIEVQIKLIQNIPCLIYIFVLLFSQKHSVNDSGVCVDDTDDQIINKQMSKVELAGKTQAVWISIIFRISVQFRAQLKQQIHNKW